MPQILASSAGDRQAIAGGAGSTKLKTSPRRRPRSTVLAKQARRCCLAWTNTVCHNAVQRSPVTEMVPRDWRENVRPNPTVNASAGDDLGSVIDFCLRRGSRPSVTPSSVLLETRSLIRRANSCLAEPAPEAPRSGHALGGTMTARRQGAIHQRHHHRRCCALRDSGVRRTYGS
ncbi:hypothetical protein BAUCODRAFT_330929 [Baudoinia panamericana UAMH 10762]|uniref:Uncharacterized protein n=1 Tax=Baudoinia panamericana (strain UAMH 10762) TaxID=717646 RepID=M2LAQ0_BAUPA|nr:uncharacterized protein BAUCODRAFT_330929 [Baudoinia panamericana UAMH 10762]EMC90892.1 hypothetical protein BAUCODRAFT_330929 [Baudoinia panamericana UAMH 10762]